ncbi:heat shock protein GrpE [Rubripirellula obstinata]|uniref:Protein GrpE n=1 Tax=Rubripirellula obstinata TaxID=406547 RepID=A0A5B1CQT3_9BACT|nr:heat shock protein GrpE [Rubripirellula obstinata]
MSENREHEDFDNDGDVDGDVHPFDAAMEDAMDVETSVGETRDEEMDRLRETAESADKRVLMAQAEAENFRKRMRRDFEDQLKYAAVPIITDILLVRDNLLRAIEAAGDSPEVAGLRDGVAMVTKQFDDAMAKHGIREIPAEGELFDPNFHEAISQMPGDAPEGTVAHVAVTGFQMHDRVIRPSQVVVSTGPA